jgi:hypothetical protein
MFPQRYNIQNFKQAIFQPSKFSNEIKQLANKSLMQAVLRAKFGDEREIHNRDWDNMIILDACRYDIFQQYADIGGKIEPTVSKASSSVGFYRENFSGRNHNDTVLVTQNPHVEREVEAGTFYKRVTTFDRDEAEQWEGGKPKPVFDIAKSEINSISDKKFIIHFMQPHAPYHGKKAEELRANLHAEKGIVFTSFDSDEKITEADPNKVYHNIPDAAEGGVDISYEKHREIYIENFLEVQKYVLDLLEILNGRTVITSDHGELLGDPPTLCPTKYKHPGGTYCQELRVVPWCVVEEQPRPEIIYEQPECIEQTDTKAVDEQLKSLGYKV